VALTRRRRNELFQTISEKGLNPADCQLDILVATFTRVDGSAPNHALIVHQPTGSEFGFREVAHRGQREGSYEVWWNAADGDELGKLFGQTWRGMLDALAGWADVVRRESEVPDLWAELKRAQEILAAVEADVSKRALHVRGARRHRPPAR
jgi:hypothetical protein